MKKSALLILVWLCLAVAVRASDQQRFVAANNLYETGKFSQALEAYARLAADMSNWKLEFNMGNCCVKLQRLVDAKIHYLRARRLAPRRREILHNLDYVDSRLGEKPGTRNPGFLEGLWDRFRAVVPLNAVSLLLLLCVMGINACLLRLLWRGRSKWCLYALGACVLAGLLLAGVQSGYVRHLKGGNSVVVVRDNARLRSGPGTGHTVLFTLRPGLEARILERRAQWLQVAAGEDIAGWIRADAVAVI